MHYLNQYSRRLGLTEMHRENKSNNRTFILLSVLIVAIVMIAAGTFYYFSKSRLTPGEKALRDYKNSVSELKSKLEKNPDDILLNKDYAYALYVTQHPDAIAALNRLLELNNKDDRAYNHLGNLYRKEKEYQKAIDAYSSAIANNPENLNAYINKAHAYLYDLQDSEAGLQVFKEAIEQNPEEENLYILLAKHYRRLNRESEAVEVLNDLLEFAPGNATALKMLEEV